MAFENIAGYEKIKKELMLIQSWYLNKEQYKKEGIDIPRGILFHGPIGTGKSLFAREFIRMFPNANVVMIDGNDAEDPRSEINQKFKKAKEFAKDGLCFVIIDEIDYLCSHYLRDLLIQIDGVDKDANENVFVIATTNDKYSINNSLTRKGRIDYIIGIGYPDKLEREKILKYYFEKYHISGLEDFQYMSEIIDGMNIAEMKSLVNELVLRYGPNPTMDDYEDVVDKTKTRDTDWYEGEENKTPETTKYHEIGHAVLIHKHKKYFSFYKACIKKDSIASGCCSMFVKKEFSDDLNRYIAEIEVAIAGRVASKIFLKTNFSGEQEDLERARYCSAVTVNTYGYKGLKCLFNHDRNALVSNEKIYRNEKYSERILKQCEKNVTKYIKKNKKKISILADLLEKNGKVTRSELEQYMGE